MSNDNKTAMVYLPDGFDTDSLPLGTYQGVLCPIDEAILTSATETLKMLVSGFAKEAEWFEAEIKDAVDTWGPVSEDEPCYVLTCVPEQADRHRENLRRGADLLSTMIEQLGLIGTEFIIDGKKPKMN
ncbi:hypothetical protein FHW77_002864 [Agrobacterium sp. RC10-4-1]|uniref:hypothetical protein n=1 Tax=Agrobacterium sp. RC10-4-1 TaxID=2587039 RepID=UPI0015FCA513|nr:hypothetical protein [Agrobacterium sp. RC10-4-1]MBA8799145.1 hypothetical protein [Agrobacterium sp. RC10-4-1]